MIGDVIANVPAAELTSKVRKVSAVERGAVGGQSFDQLMANVEARETRDSESTNRRNESRDNDRRSRESNQSRMDRQASQRDVSSDVANDYGHVADEPSREVYDGQDAPTETAPVAPEVEVDVDMLIDTVANAIAEVVELPPEVVVEQLKVEGEAKVYPLELAEPYVANKFLQELYKVESPVELLNMPEYQDTLKKVVAVVAELVEQEETTVKVNLDKLSGMAVTTEDDQLVVTMGESFEDDDEAAFEILTRNSNAQAARFSSETQVQQGEAELTAIVPETVEAQIPEAVNVSPLLNAVQAAQAVTQAAPLATPTQADPAQVMQQIVSKIKTLPAENFQEIRMALRPAHLGDVTLRIAHQNGIVAAMFVAENQRVKEILESQFNQLRDALAEQGISVSELFVSVNGGEAEAQMDQFLKEQQEAMRRLQKAAGILSDSEEEAIEETTPEIMINSTVSFSA